MFPLHAKTQDAAGGHQRAPESGNLQKLTGDEDSTFGEAGTLEIARGTMRVRGGRHNHREPQSGKLEREDDINGVSEGDLKFA